MCRWVRVKHLGVVEQAGREQHAMSLARGLRKRQQNEQTACSRLKPLHTVSHVNRQRGLTRVYNYHEKDEAQQELKPDCVIKP